MKPVNQIILLAFAVFTSIANAQAQSPRDQLAQMVEQLQKTPTDNALREKIIKLAQAVKPAPAIPEEANRAFVRGNVFQKEAKDASGYGLAISAYRDALLAAPWWGDAYYNMGVALELAQKFDEAIASIKLYKVSLPAESREARDAQNRIYALEAKGELSKQAATARTVEAENSPQAKAATKTARDEDLLRSLNGVRFDCPTQNFPHMGRGNDLWFVVEGNKLRTWTKITWADADLQRANPKDWTPGTIHDWGVKSIAGTRSGDVGGIVKEIFEDRIVVTGYPSSPFSCPRKR